MSAIYQNILNSCYMWLFSWYVGYGWLPWRTTAKDREFWEVEKKIIIQKIERNLGHILGTIFDRNFSYCFQAKIVGKLYCLLALPMLVDKIWWVNCNKQHWEGEKIGKMEKNCVQWKYPNYIFVWDCRFFFLSVLPITCTCIIDRTMLYIFLFFNLQQIPFKFTSSFHVRRPWGVGICISCNRNHLLCSSISLRLSYLVNNILKNVLINVCYSLPRYGGIQESLIRILLGIDILQVSFFAACFLFFSHSNVMIKTKIQ